MDVDQENQKKVIETKVPWNDKESVSVLYAMNLYYSPRLEN